MRIGCVDFVSNTFFPAIAAEELDFFSAEGIEAHVHLIRTVAAFPALRDGQVDVLAAPAHSVLRAFPLCASGALPRLSHLSHLALVSPEPP